MKYHGICNRVFQKNTLNTIADDTNSAGDKIHRKYYHKGFVGSCVRIRLHVRTILQSQLEWLINSVKDA